MDIRFSGVIKRINYISPTTTTHGTTERRKARKIMHTQVPRFLPEQWSPEEDHTSVEKSNKKQRKWRSNSKSHKSYLHDIFRGKDSRCLHMLLLCSDTPQLAGLNFDPKLPKKLQHLHWDVSLVSPIVLGSRRSILDVCHSFSSAGIWDKQYTFRSGMLIPRCKWSCLLFGEVDSFSKNS